MAIESGPFLPRIIIRENERLEICIPSRGRTWNLVCLLQALRSQRFKAWDLTIVDDNPDDQLKDHFTLQALLALLEMEGHRTRVIKGSSAGVTRAHNILLSVTTKSLIARIDDDTLPADNDYLSSLMAQFFEDASGMVGAVGGPIPHFRGGTRDEYRLPCKEVLERYAPFENPELRYLHPAGSKPRAVTMLYSSFIYKRAYFEAAGGFSLSYSPIAEKEETDILLRVGSLGARLIFHPDAVLWHLKAPTGGTRHMSGEERQHAFESDYRNFIARAKQLKDGTFPWQDEAGANLTPFERYKRAIREDDRGYLVVEDEDGSRF